MTHLPLDEMRQSDPDATHPLRTVQDPQSAATQRQSARPQDQGGDTERISTTPPTPAGKSNRRTERRRTHRRERTTDTTTPSASNTSAAVHAQSFIGDTRSKRHQRHPHDSIAPFFTRTLAGFFAPGVGMALSGRRKLGYLMLGLYAVALGVALAIILLKGPAPTLIAIASRKPLPHLILAAHVLALAAWCASIIATGRWNTPTSLRVPRFLTSGWIALLCTLLIAPTATAAWFGNQTLASVASIQRHFGTGSKGPTGDASNPWAGTPTVNVLIIGSDAGANREGYRPDTMMVAHINTESGKTVLFGIPRQLQGFTLRPDSPLKQLFPGERVLCPQQPIECMLNAMPMRARDVLEQYPAEQQEHAGLHALTDIIEDFLGLTIDNTVVMQMRGLTETVEALGGVTINVKQRLPIGGKVTNGYIQPGSIHGWIEPGLQHLSGEQAKWYARSRATTDNDDRMNRQRCLVGAMIKQIGPAQVMANYAKLTTVLADNVQTDINLSPNEATGLPAWLGLLEKVRTTGSIRSINFIAGKNINMERPNYDTVHASVTQAIDGTPLPTPSTSSPTSAETTTSTGRPHRSPDIPASQGATPTPTSAPPAMDLSEGC